MNDYEASLELLTVAVIGACGGTATDHHKANVRMLLRDYVEDVQDELIATFKNALGKASEEVMRETSSVRRMVKMERPHTHLKPPKTI